MTEEVKKESLYDTYQKEMVQDLLIDRINLEEVQLRLPALKGKWVARLMNAKRERDKLENLFQDAIEQIGEKIKKESIIEISKISAEKQAESHILAKKIKNEIKDQEYIITYLDKMEKVLSSMSFDCSNIINLMKLEIN